MANVVAFPFTQVAAGSTQSGKTKWEQEQNSKGEADPFTIKVWVDTAFAHFAETPIYIATLGGLSDHYFAIGAVYSPAPNGFWFYVHSADLNVKLSPATAGHKDRKWHVNWIGIVQKNKKYGG